MSHQLALLDALPTQGGTHDYWPTPAWLAQRVVDWCGSAEGLRVTEPSAGRGALVEPLTRAGALVDAIEIDASSAAHLAEKYSRVQRADFLALEPPRKKYDLCVANPPFSGGLDTAFLERSLDWAHRTVAILRTHALHGRDRHERVWSRVHLLRLALCVGRPSFGGGTPQHEFCAVMFMRRTTPRFDTQVEWWETP